MNEDMNGNRILFWKELGKAHQKIIQNGNEGSEEGKGDLRK